MDSMELITKLLGWSCTINLGLLVLASIALTSMRGPMARMHASMFGMSEEEVARQYFQYLGNYKALILVFNLAPYIALRIIG